MKWVNEWDSRLEYVDNYWLYFDGHPFEGYMYDLWDNGQMSYKETYVGGLPNGDSIYWNDEGGKISEALTTESGSVRRSWHDNGQLAEETITSSDGAFKRTRWDELGQEVQEGD